MATLKISDLSVGDWVEYEGLHYPITFVGYGEGDDGSLVNLIRPDLSCFTCKISDIRPIPITAEILEKNGWSEFSDYHNSWKLDIDSDKRVWMFKNSHDWTFQVMSWGLGHNHSVAKAYIKDVHQLQHALRLAEVDKEINL